MWPQIRKWYPKTYYRPMQDTILLLTTVFIIDYNYSPKYMITHLGMLFVQHLRKAFLYAIDIFVTVFINACQSLLANIFSTYANTPYDRKSTC